ncbi:MAG: hypothetical protein ACKO96_39315, partial [Flammeovirgaceae bacterium]
ENMVRRSAEPQDWELCTQRFRFSAVEIEAGEGSFVMKTGAGGVMGDPFVVEGFSGAFMVPVQRWKRRIEEERPSVRLFRPKYEGVEIELGLYKYADGILHTAVLPKDNQRPLKELYENDENIGNQH